jgi:hypothetical protein
MLLDAWRRARLAERAAQDGTSLAEVIATDRREFGELSLAALAAAAAAASDTIARADPTPLTIEELEAEQGDIFAVLHSVAPAVLLPRVAGNWKQVESYLQARLTLSVRTRLTVLAGHFARALATLGRFAGEQQMARRFAVLAGQHAEDTGDPLLVGAVALLRSRIALDAGQYGKAADIAGRARLSAHPGQRARLSAYQAEALGAAGRDVEARDALAAMRDAMAGAICSSVPAVISWNDTEEALYGAMTLVRLSDGIKAERLALRAAGEYVDDDEGVGLAHVTAARALIAREHPDPGAAVGEALATLDVVRRVPNAVISGRLASVHGELTRRWATLPDVRALSDQLTAAGTGNTST